MQPQPQPSTPPPPHHQRSSSPSLSLRSKRPLSSPAPSTAPLKRANSEDTHMGAPAASSPAAGGTGGGGTESGDEGSIGASRLNIASTPRSVSDADGDGEGDTTLLPASPAPSDDPPAYASADEGARDDAASSTTTSSDDDEQDFSRPTQRPPGYNGPAGENQLSVILDLQRQPLEEGDVWYLLSRQWYRRWKVACSGGRAEEKEDMELEGLRPEEVGEVDNGSLLEEVVEGEEGRERLRRNPPVREGVDVELVPAPAWRYLEEWYGLLSPTHSLPRTVLAPSGPTSETIEFYPPSFKLFLLLPSTTSSPTQLPPPALAHAPSTELPSSAPFSDLVDFAKKAFELPRQREVRLWRLPPVGDDVSASAGEAYVLSDKLRETGVELLQFSEGEISLADALLSDPETRVAVEVRREGDGGWVVDAEEVQRALGAMEGAESAPAEEAVVAAAAPEKEDGKKEKKHHHHHTLGGLFSNGWSAGLHHASSSKKDKEKKDEKEKSSTTGGLLGAVSGALTRSKTLGSRLEQAGSGRTRGLVGLQNLGNTCFMNSAIQCMSNTKELQEYFLSGVYKSELNPSNPLGMRGQVATAFGELIERLWHGTSSSVAPREFKQALARFAPQFSGYGQQDSQELLAFLLDGTHEDLNRILKKPATEAPDWEGGGDRELVEMARTCWQQYRARNDSVIVDLFQGQYRSTVVCPDCDKVSITFDPFMYVTTNLPVVKKWEGRVFVVPLDSARKVIAVDCEVAKSGTIKTLKGVVGKLVDIDPKRLIVTEEFSHKFWKEWHDDEAVTDIQRNDRIIFYETTSPFPQPRPRDNLFGGFGRRASPAPPTKPVDPDAPVHIVVAHRKPASSSSSSSSSSRPIFGTRPSPSSANGELFGSPFVVTLSAQEACSEEAIRRKVVEQYVRVTKREEELRELVEEEIEGREEERRRREIEEQQQPTPAVAQANEAATSEAVPMEVDQSAPAPAPVPATSATTGSIDPSLLDAAAAGGSASSSSLSTAADSQPSTSTSAEPSTQNSTTSSALPSARPASPSAPAAEDQRRKAPYRLEVVKRLLRDNGRPAIGQCDYSDPTEPLENKAEVLRKLGGGGVVQKKSQEEETQEKKEEEDVDMFSTSAASTAKDGEEAAAPATAPAVDGQEKVVEESEKPAATAAVPEPPKSYPLVKNGHYLVASWDSTAWEYFFGGENDAWGEVEEVIDPSLAAKRANKGKDKKAITLQDCLTEFTKEERLSEDNEYYCGRCKEFKQATKKVELWKVPDVLVFALKRFSSSRYSRDKVDDFVDTPFELDMTPFVEGDKVEKRLLAGDEEEAGGLPPTIETPDSLTYDLYAVSNHFGGLGGGHYTAFAKNPDNGKWYDFDDSRVSEIPPSRVRSPAAYLLFYRRRTARPIGGRRTEELISSANASRAASAAPSLSASLTLERPGTAGSESGEGDEAPLPGAFSGTQSTSSFVQVQGQGTAPPSDDPSHRFAGLYNPVQTLPLSHGLASPAASASASVSSAEPGSPRDMSSFGEDVDWDKVPTPPGVEAFPPPLVTAQGEDRLGQVEDFLGGGVGGVVGGGEEKEGEGEVVEEIRVDGQ